MKLQGASKQRLRCCCCLKHALCWVMKLPKHVSCHSWILSLREHRGHGFDRPEGVPIGNVLKLTFWRLWRSPMTLHADVPMQMIEDQDNDSKILCGCKALILPRSHVD